MIARRDLLFAGACAAAAGTAEAIRPRRRLSLLGKGSLESAVPVAFGPWTSGADEGLVKPKLEGLAATLYSETISRIYRRSTDGAEAMLLIAYGDTQSDLLQLHRPESCYPAFGFMLSDIGPLRIPLAGGVAIPARRLTATAPGREEHVVYWSRLGEFLPASSGEQRLDRLRTAMMGYVADGVLVRCSAIGPDRAAADAVITSLLGSFVIAMNPSRRRVLIGTGLADALAAQNVRVSL